MAARDLEKAVQQCPLLVPCAEVAALLDHRIVTGEHSIPREQHSAVLTAGLPRTEILKSLLVWTVPTFAPMSLLWSSCGSPSRLDVSFAEAAVQR